MPRARVPAEELHPSRSPGGPGVPLAAPCSPHAAPAPSHACFAPAGLRTVKPAEVFGPELSSQPPG